MNEPTNEPLSDLEMAQIREGLAQIGRGEATPRSRHVPPPPPERVHEHLRRWYRSRSRLVRRLIVNLPIAVVATGLGFLLGRVL